MRASRLQVLLALAASDLVGAASVGASALHSHYLPTACPSRTTSPACMAGKKVAYGDEARASLIRGVDKVANAVKVTIGPRGRNVVIRILRCWSGGQLPCGGCCCLSPCHGEFAKAAADSFESASSW